MRGTGAERPVAAWKAVSGWSEGVVLLAFHPEGQPLRREEPVAETKPFYCELLSGRSRVSGDVHARFWESAGVRFPRATHRVPSKAVYEMGVGPSQPGCRIRLQTTLSCSGQEPGW